MITKRLLLLVVSAWGCGGIANEPMADGGHVTSDAGDARTPAEAGLTGDGALACNSGDPHVRCLAAAGPTYSYGAIAVDDENVYWGASGQVGGDSAILRVPRSGGDVVTLAKGWSPQPGDLVSDGTRLYWDDVGPARSIVSVPVGGGALSTLASPGSAGCIAVDQDNVYWTEQTGGVFKIAKSGVGTPELLAPASSFLAYGVAVDATSVYWMAGGLIRTGLDGGTPTTLVNANTGLVAAGCRGFAISAGTVFAVYVPSSDSGTAPAEILSVPAEGSSASGVLVPNDRSGSALVTASLNHVFWEGLGTGGLEIDAIPVDGGATTVLATPAAHYIADMAVASDGTLYWTTNLQVQSVKP
jgi:hypothetical protein